MALFRIPWPWDYHGSGALIVEAPNQGVAEKRARKYLATKYADRDYGQNPKEVAWNETYKVDGYVTEDNGCDC